MKVHCLFDEMCPPGALIPHPKNRNDHPADQIERLARILEYQGWRYPIKVSNRSGYITSGHGRLEAAKLKGWLTVPVNFQDYDSDEQEYADVVADNAIASWAELDLSGINIDIVNLGPELDVDLLGIRGFTVEPADKDTGKGNDDAPEKPAIAKTKPGDLWILGEHRLLCGDNRVVLELDRLLQGKKADLVFTDPPYNLASDSKLYAGTGEAWFGSQLQKLKDSEWDKNFDVRPSLDLICDYVCAPDCSVYVWSSHFLIPVVWERLAKWADHVSFCVWHKTNPMPSLAKRHWTFSTELCAYATRGKHVFNFPAEGHAYNCWVKSKYSDGTHPTQKAYEVCEEPILRSSNRGQLVVDLFLGSGTTLIVCENTGRVCYGMEIDPLFCDVIVERWEKFTGKKAFRPNS